MDKLSLNEFSDILASSSPTPGGGGASALVGALAASLSQMVTSLTTGKKKYAEYEEEIQDIMHKMDDLRHELLLCINEDKEAFEPLSKAYSLSKDTPNYNEILEDCLKKAASIPFKILQFTALVIKFNQRLATIGSKLAISDAASAAALALGTLKAAAINVKVNTRLMKDKEYALDLDNKTDKLVNDYSLIAEETYNEVLKRLTNG